MSTQNQYAAYKKIALWSAVIAIGTDLSGIWFMSWAGFSVLLSIGMIPYNIMFAFGAVPYLKLKFAPKPVSMQA